MVCLCAGAIPRQYKIPSPRKARGLWKIALHSRLSGSRTEREPLNQKAQRPEPGYKGSGSSVPQPAKPAQCPACCHQTTSDDAEQTPLLALPRPGAFARQDFATPQGHLKFSSKQPLSCQRFLEGERSKRAPARKKRSDRGTGLQ